MNEGLKLIELSSSEIVESPVHELERMMMKTRGCLS